MRSQTVKLDSAAPTVQIASPIEGDQLGGQRAVNVEATDSGSGVANVDLYVDGDYAGFSAAKASPYEITGMPALAPGTHKLKAVATDALGNSANSSPVTVTIKAPPGRPDDHDRV